MFSLKSLKTKLFLWYIGSLIIQGSFFLLVIHILGLPYGMQLFILLFLILSLIGFIIIYKITGSLSYLSFRMKSISRKNLDEKIEDIKREDEIGELAESFNNLLGRINEAFKREQQFIGDIAHELKTPLTTLRTTFEVNLRHDRSKEEYKNAIEDAIIEVDRMSSTLKNVLDLAWFESPNEKKNTKKFNLSELMEDLYDITQKMALGKKISVEKSIEKNIYILGFKERLAHAVLNLIDNAIKYTPNNGSLEILLEKIPDKALISIKDSGKGISKEDLPNIFDRFYRGSKTDKIFGSGLGLAITKSIILLHRGDIKVKSKVEEGTTFVIILPLYKS